MKVLIVDDEPLARARLKRLLAEIQGYQYVGEAATAVDAVLMAQQLAPDLVFLDIEMPDQDGLTVAAELRQLTPPPAVVFITAHPQHALAAYQVAPADYLLKPISARQLQESLMRLGCTTRAHLEKQQQQSWFSYKSGTKQSRIELAKLYYLQAGDKYVRLVFEGGEALIETSLKQLEEAYPLDLVRIHRHTLVAQRRIKALHQSPDGRHLLELWQHYELLEISRRELAKIKTILSDNSQRS